MPTMLNNNMIARNVYLLYSLGVITADQRGWECGTCRSIFKFISLIGNKDLRGVLLSKHQVLRRFVSPTSTIT